MAALPPFHVGQQLFHEPCQAKEVCVEELLHGSDTLALQRSNHANTSIVHYNSRVSYVITCLWRDLKFTLKVSVRMWMRGDRPRTSTRLSGRLLTHSLMEASQQASNCLISRVLFKESPAAFSKGPRFLRSLIVATTASDKQWIHWLSVAVVISIIYSFFLVEESEWLTFKPSKLILGQPCSHSQANARGAPSYQHPPGSHGSLTSDPKAQEDPECSVRRYCEQGNFINSSHNKISSSSPFCGIKMLWCAVISPLFLDVPCVHLF